MAQPLRFGIHISIADFKPNPEIKSLYMGSSVTTAFQVIKRELPRVPEGSAMHVTILRLTKAMIAAREKGDLSNLPGWMKETKRDT